MPERLSPPYLLLPAVTMISFVGIYSLSGSSFDLLMMVGFYVLAKFLEHFDDRIFAITGALSGHTLKHIAAATAPVVHGVST